MSDMFKKGGLRPPPVMGQRARSKLNKHNYYRMPPNLKGVPSAAKGGLGGAVSKGRKMRKGYAEGGFVDEDIEVSGGLSGPSLQELQADPELLNERLDMGYENLVRPRQERKELDAAAQAQQDKYAEVLKLLKPPSQGANLPLMQFAAGMLSPTKTGSFGESLGMGIGSGVTAAQKQREQEQEFQTLQAKLGLGSADAAYNNALKLEELDQRREIADWMRQAKIDAANIAAQSKNKGVKRSVYDEKAEDAFLDRATVSDVLAEQARRATDLVDKVGTGGVEGSDTMMWLKKAGTFDEEDEAAIDEVEKVSAQIKAEAAQALRTPGSISNFEQQLYGAAAGAGTSVSEPQLKKIFFTYALAKDLEGIKAGLWNEVSDQMTFNQFKRKWAAGEFDDVPEVQEIKEKFEEIGAIKKSGEAQPATSKFKYLGKE